MLLTCERLTTPSCGVSSTADGPVLLPGLLPGEVAEVSSIIKRQGRKEAVVEGVAKPSAMRKTPRCPLSGICGGCDFDHVDEADGAAIKRSLVVSRVSRVLGRDASSLYPEAIWAPSEGYRARCRVHLSMRDRRMGFLAKRSNELVEVRDCPLLSPKLKDFLSKPDESLRRAWSQALSKGVNKKTGYVELPLFDADDRVLIGSDEGVKTIGSIAYKLSAAVFFQSNPILMPRLLDFVREHATGDRIMDLYSGVGTFSALFEGHGRTVTAVEKDPSCLAFARKNAPSANFFTDDVALWGRKRKDEADCIIVDPPRTGLGEDASRLVSSWKAQRIIYVSCDSRSMARDLTILSQAYEAVEGLVIDFYPSSSHEESVLVLDRRQDV